MKEFYCIVCGRKHNGRHSPMYCRKHQYQIEKYGRVLDNNPRNKFDPNEFRFLDNGIVEFDTYLEPSMNVYRTYLIDADDYPLVSKYKWHTNVQGYAISSNLQSLHRLITNAKPGQQVDHINLDMTDNRKSNLRIANNSLNQTNRKPYNQLQIKGVQYHKFANKYSAYFRMYGKQYHSTCYNTKEEAAFARFILEQMFRKGPLTQFSTELINTLSEPIKKKIIDDLKRKFNRE